MEPEKIHLKHLLEGCLRHDRTSQKSLYKEFYSYGMSICLRYADSRDEAAEILNDGFMKIFSTLNKFDFDKPFQPWLRKILINLSINRYHKRQRQVETEEITEFNNGADDERILSGISYQEVVELLHKLPPSYRAVFNLHVIEGYSHEEIAVMLNISAGTSKSNLFKAKEHLKKIVGEFFEVDYVRTR
ncbi:DNA-directed RNA polymerase sigma-70 factor [Cytophagales bacterium WSM2-2]|nr:DNA-directed RNA polymerase sigma-70 factor [Cytophagales bacterium WSM2-2]